MTPVAFIHELLESNTELFQLICAFNGNPQTKNIPDWFPQETTQALLSSPRSRRNLMRISYEKQAPDLPAFYDFRNPRLRLALIEPEILRQLTLWSGAAIQAQTIAKVIDRKTRGEIRTLLGEKGFEWALKRAALFSTLLPPLNLSTGLHPTQAIWQGGQASIQACVSGMPDAFGQRILPKLPKELNWDLTYRVKPETRDATWRFVGRILLKEIAPKWQPCFE